MMFRRTRQDVPSQIKSRHSALCCDKSFSGIVIWSLLFVVNARTIGTYPSILEGSHQTNVIVTEEVLNNFQHQRRRPTISNQFQTEDLYNEESIIPGKESNERQKESNYNGMKSLLLHRLTVVINESQSSSKINSYMFDLHPSEIIIAERERDRREREKRRRRMLENSNATLLYNKEKEVEEDENYQANYAWMLEEEAFHKRRKDVIRRIQDDDDDAHHLNAVYATIPDQSDPKHSNNRHLQDFFAHRHLSRFEKQYRIGKNIDLQKNWDGIYLFPQHPVINRLDNEENVEKADWDVSKEALVKNKEKDNNRNHDSINDNVYNNKTTNSINFKQKLGGLFTTRRQPHYRPEQHHKSSKVILNIRRNLTSADDADGQPTIQEDQASNTTEEYDDEGNSSRRIDVGHETKIGSTESVAETAEVVGGQYDNYQQVPLSQGYGTHFANVWVGSPTPQRKTVIVDTGSHYTAFPCSGCKHCGAPHHTDPYFKPELSETFHQLQCDECKDNVICDNGQCKFHQMYTEGSSWDAIQVRDRFYCGGADVLDSVNPDDQRHAIDFMFGCQVSMTGLFVTQLADGIMGMSAHPATFPKKLFDARKIEHNLFAMCYRRELGTSKRGVTAGSMTIGGVSNNLDTSPMVYAKNLAQAGWYTVYVKAMYIRTGGGQSARSDIDDSNHQTIKVRFDPSTLNSGKGVIVDSGTTDTYLNRRLAREFMQAWKQATGQIYTHSPMKLTVKQLHSLPTILIQCQAYSHEDDPSVENYENIPGYAGKLDPDSPRDLLIAIPSTSYMDYSPITKRYMSRLYFTETVGGVLGANTMQGHNVLFDWQNGRVGFAESTCAYDKKKAPQSVMDNPFPTDCAVSQPILTTTCVDTVDKVMCKDSPTNIALLGTETWTAVVINTGNDAGISCIQAAHDLNGEAKKTRSRLIQSNIVEYSVRCDGTGLCVEERPCQLTCQQAAAAEKVLPIGSRNSQYQQFKTKVGDKQQSVECGDSGWSACDYGCEQTRIQSQMFSDGFCHEVSRESRPCHIGACARHDPCRVPFIVHVVLGFRNGEVSMFTRNSKEILGAALTEAMAEKFSSHNSTQLFTEGEVHVVSAVPWYHDKFDDDVFDIYDDGDDISSNPLGVKVVLEISMFNPFADVDRTSPFDAKEPNELDAITNIVQNFSDRVRRKKTPIKCRQDELYALAKHALTTKKLLLEDDIMPNLIHRIKTKLSGDRVGAAPFGPLFDLTYDITQSRLLSVWTIRTGLEEEINYFGPQKSYIKLVLVFAQNFISLLALLLAAVVCLNYALAGYEYIVEKYFYRDKDSIIPILPRHPPNCSNSKLSLSHNDVDEDDLTTLEDVILMGNFEVTNRQMSSSYKMVVAKKRFVRLQNREGSFSSLSSLNSKNDR